MKNTDDKLGSLPRLSSENFDRLSPEAQAALCFRAAARLLPLLGGGSAGLSFWPGQEQREHLMALFTALELALLQGLEHAFSVPPLSHEALGMAVHEAHAAYQDEMADYRVIDTLADVLKADPALTANQALEAFEASHLPISVDLAWWLENGEGEWRRSLGRAFLERPLWLSPDGEEPPKEWFPYFDRWQRVVAALGLSPLVERYEGWLRGEIEPAETISRRIEEWYAEHRSRSEEGPEEFEFTSMQQKAAPLDVAGMGADLAQEWGEEAGMWANVAAGQAAEPFAPSQPAVAETASFDSGEFGAGVVTAQADKPAEVDHLGRASLVNTLADMLASPAQSLPMTIALLGDWGAGKSSVIEQLKMRLVELAEVRKIVKEQDNVCGYLFAEFNAWEYEQTDNIRAGLAQEVVNGLIRDQNWIQKTLFAFANAWRQHRWEFGWSLLGFASVILATVVALFFGEVDLARGAAGPFIGVGGAVLFSFVLYRAWNTARTVLEHPLASQLRTYLKLPSYGQHLGLVPVIRRQIAALCEHRLGSFHNGRLLVVVDDLDRCSPECITDTLDAVRLVMSLDNVAVIIAIDDRVAFQAVARHYAKLGDERRPGSAIARDYLGKIIQLPINLPQPGMPDLKSFIHESLFDVKSSVDKGKKEDKGSTGHERELERGEGESSSGAEENREDSSTTLGEEPTDLSERASARKENGGYVERHERTAQIKASFERSRRKMEDSEEERDWFEALAQILEFSNPRQLIRLKNSYRFLKGANHEGRSGGDGRLASRAMMAALFWSEYLYQMPLIDPLDSIHGRHHAEVRMWNILVGKESGKEPTPEVAMASQFREVLDGLGRSVDDYFQLMRQVAMVVMPSAQGGVFLSREALESWVPERSDT